MREEPPVFFTLPHDLSDEAACNLCEFLNAFVMALEKYYSVQLRRHYKKLEKEQELRWLCHDLGEDVPF